MRFRIDSYPPNDELPENREYDLAIMGARYNEITEEVTLILEYPSSNAVKREPNDE